MNSTSKLIIFNKSIAFASGFNGFRVGLRIFFIVFNNSFLITIFKLFFYVFCFLNLFNFFNNFQLLQLCQIDFHSV